MLQLFDKSKTHPVPVEIDGDVTVFNLRSMTIKEKVELLHDINMTVPDDAKDEMGADEANAACFASMEKICKAIVSIVGYDEKPIDVLQQLENLVDLQVIIGVVIDYCMLKPEQVKNSDSLPAQPTPAPVGDAEKSA